LNRDEVKIFSSIELKWDREPILAVFPRADDGYEISRIKDANTTETPSSYDQIYSKLANVGGRDDRLGESRCLVLNRFAQETSQKIILAVDKQSRVFCLSERGSVLRICRISP
jgi:hypothetical protein